MVKYECDTEKNTECSKSNCHVNGGPCIYTIDKSLSIEPISVEAKNPLKHMIEMQKEFQDRCDPRYKSEDLTERAAFLRDHFVFCDQELQEMLYEIPFLKSWKDYSKMTDAELVEAYEKAQVELIDAWHFFMNLALGLGMDAELFYKIYCDKHKENIRRQDEGYDHTMRHI